MSAANMDLMQQQQQQPPMQALPQRRARQAMSRLFTVLVSAAAVAMLPAARACCKASSPTPRSSAPTSTTSMGYPRIAARYTAVAESRSAGMVSIPFFEAGNYVYIEPVHATLSAVPRSASERVLTQCAAQPPPLSCWNLCRGDIDNDEWVECDVIEAPAQSSAAAQYDRLRHSRVALSRAFARTAAGLTSW